MAETTPRKSDAVPVTSAHTMLNSINNLRFVAVTTVLVWITTSLPISKLSIGLAYRSQCPMQEVIPLWLIVSGMRGLFCMVLTLGIMIFAVLTDRNCLKASSNLLMIAWFLIVVVSAFFNFAWSILGVFWSLSKTSTVQHDIPGQITTYCHATPYFFVVIAALIQTLMLLLFLLIVLLYVRRHLATLVALADHQRKSYRLYTAVFVLALVFLT